MVNQSEFQITLVFRMAQINTLDHAESTGDVQEKSAKLQVASCRKLAIRKLHIWSSL